MSKELEAFSRMSNMLTEYEDFIMELPCCPDWETEYDSSDDGVVYDALKEKEKQDSLIKSGDLSDGYHTFNDLYYQRCVLFASIVNSHKDISWKSFKHEDGKYCFDSNGEWFIVGIDTPEGSYTYHYEKKYWDMFKCKELETSKHWDGHTEKDVTRLLSL